MTPARPGDSCRIKYLQFLDSQDNNIMLSFAFHAKRCLTTLELMLIFVTLIQPQSLFMFLGSGVGRKATDIRGDRSSGTNLAG